MSMLSIKTLLQFTKSLLLCTVSHVFFFSFCRIRLWTVASTRKSRARRTPKSSGHASFSPRFHFAVIVRELEVGIGGRIMYRECWMDYLVLDYWWFLSRAAYLPSTILDSWTEGLSRLVSHGVGNYVFCSQGLGSWSGVRNEVFRAPRAPGICSTMFKLGPQNNLYCLAAKQATVTQKLRRK